MLEIGNFENVGPANVNWFLNMAIMHGGSVETIEDGSVWKVEQGGARVLAVYLEGELDIKLLSYDPMVEYKAATQSDSI